MQSDHMNERSLRRSDLAQATGCNLETIRYYEGVDLLPAPARTAAGHRVYSGTDVKRLGFIMRARELGFSLDDIRGLLGLGDGALRSCAEVRDRTEVHLADVRTRIADLQRIEAVLSRTAALCTGEDRPDCAVLDSLNRPGFTGGQNSRRIARYGTDTKEEDREAVFT